MELNLFQTKLALLFVEDNAQLAFLDAQGVHVEINGLSERSGFFSSSSRQSFGFGAIRIALCLFVCAELLKHGAIRGYCVEFVLQGLRVFA